MSTEPRFYAIRQCTSGKIIGSRTMTRREAEREVAAWRDAIGPAVYVVARPDTRSAVRREDQEALRKLMT